MILKEKMIITNNLKFSLFNDTFDKVSEVLQNQYTGILTSSRGRKQPIPKRVAGSSTAYYPKERNSSQRRFSKISRSRRKRKRQRSKVQKSCVDMKIVPQSIGNTGELCTSSGVRSSVRSALNLTFEPDNYSREISPGCLETTGRNTQKRLPEAPPPRNFLKLLVNHTALFIE